MKRAATILLLVVTFPYCTHKVITGTITHVSGDTVTVKGKRFKTYTDTNRIGQKATFTPSVNRRKINSRRVPD